MQLHSTWVLSMCAWTVGTVIPVILVVLMLMLMLISLLISCTSYRGGIVAVKMTLDVEVVAFQCDKNPRVEDSRPKCSRGRSSSQNSIIQYEGTRYPFALSSSSTVSLRVRGVVLS